MFWADSACISQQDVYERGRQVTLMGTIYRSAELVTVWLGPAADDSDFGIDKMMEWKDVFKDLIIHCGGSPAVAVANIAAEDPMFFGPLGSEQDCALRAIQAKYCRPWWRKAWTCKKVRQPHHIEPYYSVESGTSIGPVSGRRCTSLFT